jgi:hypothetical protein
MIKMYKKNYIPKRPIRRSQIISMFGVGSIYQFKNQYSNKGDSDSLMLAGLDAWFNNSMIEDEWKIFEPRLQKVLKKDFFVKPPDFREKDDNKNLKFVYLPYLRFPTWHYCHVCGNMKKLSPYSNSQRCEPLIDSNGDYIHKDKFKNCTNKKVDKRRYLIPVRFMYICAAGHIDDFPFMKWIHDGKETSENCELKFFGGSGGGNSLENIKVGCVKCNIVKNIAPEFDNSESNSKNNLNRKCSGAKPWLGNNEFDKCNQQQLLVLRQASNAYYPVIKSSIYIPIKTNSTNRKILEFINQKKVWDVVLRHKDSHQGLEDAIRTGLSFSEQKYKSLDLKEVLEAINNKKLGLEEQNKITPEKSDEEELYRNQEYNYIINSETTDEENELKLKKIPIDQYGSLKKYFSNIFLIEKLIETRVQRGFTRLNPYDGDGKNSNLQPLFLDNKINWLPVNVVTGEGIFFEFNAQNLNTWLKNFNTKNHENIIKNYNDIRSSKKISERIVNTKFFLIHTFSHLLINQLSYSCGYGSASLKERIYCNQKYKDKEMHGLLIYTASGDSEGSMGGLVREGEPKNIKKIIHQAVKKSVTCSYDPVCLDHKSQGLNGTNASACHACCFVPETSCEESNQLLDRTTIIGNEKGSFGYFKDILDEDI